MSDKQKLRFELRNIRKDFEKDHLFWPDLNRLPDLLCRTLDSARLIAGYVRSGSEVDPAGLLEHAARMGKTIALPWLADRTAPLAFRKWTPGDPLELAPFGFRQPGASAPECRPDVILAPVLGFDRAMNRLGQGAGHYDRAFAKLPDALRIGLAWSAQECKALAADPWDIPLDAVLTEKEWIAGPHSRIRA